MDTKCTEPGAFMLRAALFALAVGSMGSSATALPTISPGRAMVPPEHLVEVKIICSDSGQCIRPPRRRPVARWVYGDGAFVGPYTGPGYYGPPGSHWRWFPFGF